MRMQCGLGHTAHGYIEIHNLLGGSRTIRAGHRPHKHTATVMLRNFILMTCELVQYGPKTIKINNKHIANSGGSELAANRPQFFMKGNALRDLDLK